MFVFINKMDLPGTNRDDLISDAKKKLNDSCCRFDRDLSTEEFMEEAASHDEVLMQKFFDGEAFEDADLIRCIK